MNAAAFRDAMADLPTPPDASPPFWPYWQRSMQLMAATRHPDTFWDWPAVRHCMLTEHFTHGEQLAYLQQDWGRWERVCSDPDSLPNQNNLIHQCYHLKLWEDTTGQRIGDLGVIYEFGGGYGAMALACARLGFVGRYLICDLPEFALLQRYFLSQRGVAVEHVDAPARADLFVACFSLSETALDFRSDFERQVEADSYLLLYSARWGAQGGWDNLAWAREFMAARAGLTWRVSQYPGGQRPDWYSVGWRA